MNKRGFAMIGIGFILLSLAIIGGYGVGYYLSLSKTSTTAVLSQTSSSSQVVLATAPTVSSPPASAVPCDTICITSPRDGIIVNPGQTITINVVLASSSGITKVGLVGAGADSNFNILQLASSSPYTFSVSIPSVVTPGYYYVTAIGGLSAGGIIKSKPLTIDIEGSVNAAQGAKTPTSMTIQLSSLPSLKVGYDIPLIPEVLFSDGTKIDPTHSTSYSSTSTNPMVAKESQGSVVAVCPGSATITLHYLNVSASIPVTVLGTNIRGDINADGQVTMADLDDLQIDATYPPNATGSCDPRDLNHDGIINDKDVAIEKTLVGQ